MKFIDCRNIEPIECLVPSVAGQLVLMKFTVHNLITEILLNDNGWGTDMAGIRRANRIEKVVTDPANAKVIPLEDSDADQLIEKCSRPAQPYLTRVMRKLEPLADRIEKATSWDPRKPKPEGADDAPKPPSAAPVIRNRPRNPHRR